MKRAKAAMAGASGRPALVVAHPGHELRAYGWLEATRPRVFVLTDGSGRSGQSRLASTTAVLGRIGAEPGPIYGRFTDAAIYSAILDHDFDLFDRLANELAECFSRERTDYVAGDAAEGYNPAHDVCRLLINAAVVRARRSTGRRVGCFDFLLVGPPDSCPENLRSQAIWVRLEEQAFARKIAAARSYSELAGEVAAALKNRGEEAFRVECLRPVDPLREAGAPAEEPPFYERYGAEQVAAGHYQRVLRYRQHVAPLAEALRLQVKVKR